MDKITQFAFSESCSISEMFTSKFMLIYLSSLSIRTWPSFSCLNDRGVCFFFGKFLYKFSISLILDPYTKLMRKTSISKHHTDKIYHFVTCCVSHGSTLSSCKGFKTSSTAKSNKIGFGSIDSLKKKVRLIRIVTRF